jgi:hypothetical protein
MNQSPNDIKLQISNANRSRESMIRRQKVLDFMSDEPKSMKQLDEWLKDQRRIGTRIFIDITDMRNIISRMLASGMIKRSGHRDQSVYHPTGLTVEIAEERRPDPILVRKTEFDPRLCALMGIAVTTPTTKGRHYTENDAVPQIELRRAPRPGIQSSMGYML